ncbi:hypothetical protein SAMN02799643_02111 [Methylobacterium sp. UNCCL125]|nr:hypothetical protein SAMN02799643_02111 [Methylobacterium sp. UNCCL125]
MGERDQRRSRPDRDGEGRPGDRVAAEGSSTGMPDRERLPTNDGGRPEGGGLCIRLHDDAEACVERASVKFASKALRPRTAPTARPMSALRSTASTRARRVGDEGWAEVDGAASRSQDAVPPRSGRATVDTEARRALEPRRRPRHARRGTALPASASWSTIARGRARRLGRPCGWRQKAHPRRHVGSSKTSPARQRRCRYRHEPDRLDLARHLGWCREEQCR